MTNYKRGSEWRRWDLHIHTPGTIKNDEFEGMNIVEKWDKFYKDIMNYINDGSDDQKNIAVVGITDYLSLSNYKKMILEKRISQSINLLLPNVEMRIRPIASDSPINIHFIFDPKVVDSLDSRFFAKLRFTYESTSFSALKDQLITLGKHLNPNLSDDAAYKEGINQFVPDLESVKTVFDDDPKLRESTIIVVSNSNGDGVSGAANHSSYLENGVSPSQLTLYRQSVYQFVDAIFSAKPSDIKYFLGEGNTDDEIAVIRKCRTLKPCLHGSDAHSNKKLFEPDNGKYCWIKSDPTFNGLKQVIYEPKERVKISSLKPEGKPGYYVIDRVEIDDENFQTDPILFNDKLNCIIGGKSTGKSILLHNMAMMIDSKQVIEKTKTASSKVMKLRNVKVFWADQNCLNSEDFPSENHKIVYIPQTYLNRLSDENEEITEIDKIIQEIVLQNFDTKAIFDSTQNSIRNYKSELNRKIYDLLDFKSRITTIKNELREIGTESGIINEVKKLQLQKERLSADLNLSDKDICLYDDAMDKIREISTLIDLVQNEITSLNLIDSVVQSRTQILSLRIETRSAVNEAIEESINAANISWLENKEKLTQKLHKENSDLNKMNDEYVIIRDSLQSKISSNESMLSLTKLIQIENVKLEKFKFLKEKLKNQESDYRKLFDAVSRALLFYKEQHEIFANYVNSNSDLTKSDLEFSVVSSLRTMAFSEKVKSISDKRTLKTVVGFDDFTEINFSLKFVQKLIENIINGDIPLLKNITVEAALRDILGDWYNITYSVKMDGDPIEMMSPGKKALVLLKLLISLAESKCPILIDQPEDDLDNRSIYEDLISFIKEKKKERQIIVVTHNANIVLGSDSEEIIVANQNGQNSQNLKYKFEYRTGSIEDNNPSFDLAGNPLGGVLNEHGIQEHICDVLEGGEKAFNLRKNKYLSVLKR